MQVHAAARAETCCPPEVTIEVVLIWLALALQHASRRSHVDCMQGQDGVSAPRVTRHSKGCSCRKSHCLKKYCECFQAGIFCGTTCRCKDCRNFDGSTALGLVMDVTEATHGRAHTSVSWSRRSSNLSAGLIPRGSVLFMMGTCVSIVQTLPCLLLDS